MAPSTNGQPVVSVAEHDSLPDCLRAERAWFARGTVLAGAVLAVLLLLPTLQNMLPGIICATRRMAARDDGVCADHNRCKYRDGQDRCAGSES